MSGPLTDQEIAEIERRSEELRSGRAILVPFEEVMKEAAQMLRAQRQSSRRQRHLKDGTHHQSKRRLS